MAAVQIDHFRFSLISRELDEISKKIKRQMFRFRILKVTECFDFQKSPVWREIQNCHRAD